MRRVVPPPAMVTIPGTRARLSADASATNIAAESLCVFLLHCSAAAAVRWVTVMDEADGRTVIRWRSGDGHSRGKHSGETATLTLWPGRKAYAAGRSTMVHVTSAPCSTSSGWVKVASLR